MTRRLETLELLFTGDVALANFEASFEADLCEINFGELETALVLFLNCPTFAEKLDGAELVRTIDLNDFRVTNDVHRLTPRILFLKKPFESFEPLTTIFS